MTHEAASETKKAMFRESGVLGGPAGAKAYNMASSSDKAKWKQAVRTAFANLSAERQEKVKEQGRKALDGLTEDAREAIKESRDQGRVNSNFIRSQKAADRYTVSTAAPPIVPNSNCWDCTGFFWRAAL